jgi:hypothetical protein
MADIESREVPDEDEMAEEREVPAEDEIDENSVQDKVSRYDF